MTVRYDANRSYELDVEVCQLGVLFNGRERLFNLGEILRLNGAAEKENYTFFKRVIRVLYPIALLV